MCRDYYTNEVFGVKDNAISLFDFHNLLTQSNKNSYIDSYLQRGVNATEVSVGLNNVLQGLDNKYSWFLAKLIEKTSIYCVLSFFNNLKHTTEWKIMEN